MRKVLFFMLTSLDGFFEGPDHDLTWHNVDDEFNQFANEQLDSVDTLLFGRLTYEMMASFWPTQFAIQSDPTTAEKMNSKEKIVFSKTLPGTGWQNTRLVNGYAGAEISRLKALPGKDMIIFGSSELAASLLRQELLDELRIMVNPVLLGDGSQLFKGLGRKFVLKLIKTRTFRNGNVLLTYLPLK